MPGRYGYRALTPTFIHREILQCRERRLGVLWRFTIISRSDRRVKFSKIDLESHERGYPALLDIGRGIPVGALVYGRRSVAADIWLPDGNRRSLGTYRVIGREIKRLLLSDCTRKSRFGRRTRPPSADVRRRRTAHTASEQGRCRRARRRRIASDGIPGSTWRGEPRTH